ncbi:hypothetical protein EV2_037280 [Malus domestica]
MIYLMWNCYGLGSDAVVRAFHGLIRQYRPCVIFLSKTKMKDHRLEGVRHIMGYTYGFSVPTMGLRVVLVFGGTTLSKGLSFSRQRI